MLIGREPVALISAPNNMVERTGPERPAAHHDRRQARDGCMHANEDR